MNLSGMFSFGIKSTGEKRTVSDKSGVLVSKDGKVAESSIRSLKQGQTLQGEVVGKNGREIQIMIDKDIIFTARLERDIQLQLGQNMTFEVKSNTDAVIALRPLLENLSQNVSVLKALEEAKLPADKTMVQMVTAMMEQGMSIDKNTLNEMSRMVLGNPGADVELLVTMKALGLPITEDSIKQFQAYENFEHQMVQEMSDIAEEIPKMFEALAQKGDYKGAADLYLQLVELFGEKTSSNVGAEGNVLLAAQAFGAAASIEQSTLQESGLQQNALQQNGLQQNGLQQNGLQQPELQQAIPLPTAGLQTNEAQMEVVQAKAAQMEALQMEAVQAEAVQTENGNGTEPIALLLTGEERNNLFLQMKAAGASEAVLNQVADGSIDVTRLLQEIEHLLRENGQAIKDPKLLQLLSGKEVGVLLKNQMLNQWLLTPEAVAKRENVESLYRRLHEQTAKLTDIVSQAARDMPVLKNVAVLQNNLNFMNQLNQVFQYIQLPLKMSEQNAHGELYIYRRRKNAMNEDGSVSALLHLDLDHIGSVDIHVTMKEQNVSTKFMLSEEALIDFIAEHIHQLDERLKKRGYQLSSDFELKKADTKQSPIKEMAETQTKGNLMAQYSFDARA